MSEELREVSEAIVRAAARMMGSGSAFEEVLRAGDRVRSMGLLPVYYTNEDVTRIYLKARKEEA